MLFTKHGTNTVIRGNDNSAQEMNIHSPRVTENDNTPLVTILSERSVDIIIDKLDDQRLAAEYAIIKEMRSNAHAKDLAQLDLDDTPEALGEKHFDLQYGSTPKEQFKNLVLEFGQLPSKIKASGVPDGFVNQAFIKARSDIQVVNPGACEELNLHNRGLFRLPSEIGRLKNLKELTVATNKLQSLPFAISNLKNLETLDISYNEFNTLPQFFETFKSLNKLSLFGTPITDSFEKDINFHHCVNLDGVQTLIQKILEKQKQNSKKESKTLSIYTQTADEVRLYHNVQSELVRRVETTKSPSGQIVSARDVFVLMHNGQNQLLKFEKILENCKSALNEGASVTILRNDVKEQTNDPKEVIQFYLNQLPPKKGDKVDDSLGIVFVKAALEDSTVQNKEELFENFKLNYPAYAINEAPVHIQYGTSIGLVKAVYKDCPKNVQIEINSMLVLWDRGDFFKELYLSFDNLYNILAQMIPKPIVFSYMFKNDPDATFTELLNRCDIDLTAEYQAIEDMCSKAHGKNVTKEDGINYFNDQYGTEPLEQLENLTLEFGKLPSQIKDDNNITKEFVTKDFIRLWTEIEGKEVETCIKFSCTEKKALYRLPKIIDRLTNLEKLDLSNNYLQSLPPGIGQLINLKKLWLSSNQLTSLPSGIGQLTNLKKLYLSDNQLESLPPGIVQHTNLEELYCSRNELTSLPPGIVQLINLKKLWLSSNQLTSLPPGIGQLINLEKLYCSNNRLKSLPPGIGQLINLKKLNLSDNQLESLPPGIVRLTNLEKLYCSNNQLKSLPPGIVRLTNLSVLNLSGNQLKSLSPEIGQLTNLKSLNLKDNHLQSLPKEIGGLINLDTLWLNNNNLQPLPKEIGKLKNLSKLILFDNPMPKLPQTIKNLDNLFLLWLDHTDLAKELKLTFQQLRPSGKEDVQKLIKAALDS